MTNEILPAHIILDQLGGRRFIAMTGAKHLGHSENGAVLSFQLPSRFAKNGINAVKIKLDPSDTYSVTFMKIRGHNLATVSEHSGIYDDMLQDLFTRETGLDTHL